ncbi:MAG: DUF2721 domain-containing protein [Prosthecobacter sp.]|nr:DUF2721 domain-containing protein [Prosthecobacter sp.]
MPAISLLMLAFTNRFLGLASVVRTLHATWRSTHEPVLLAQIRSLRQRIHIIKHMQSLGVLSLIFCVASMTLLFFQRQTAGQITFGFSLGLMLSSLVLSLVEIQLSGRALDLQIQDVEAAREGFI